MDLWEYFNEQITGELYETNIRSSRLFLSLRLHMQHVLVCVLRVIDYDSHMTEAMDNCKL